MIIVIQCAAKKQPDAGRLVIPGGKPIIFVAEPETAPQNRDCVYARPDDLAQDGLTWREVLVSYNNAGDNPLGLCCAYQLYVNKAYKQLVDRFGSPSVYILSAGWGLINANFLTPYYDITFSQSAERYKRRRKADYYQDFSVISGDKNDDVVFFGGKNYVSLFCDLTKTIKGKRTVFYRSSPPPEVNGCALEKFQTRTRTNWYYECVRCFIESKAIR
jgi:hypothetical protein